MLWSLNLRHLHALAATTRLGSVSKAAQAISISQPAITQAIGKLETLFGEPLFERRPDGMAATAAASLLAPRIEAAMAHIGSPRVTMTQLRALIAVADAGSYVAASRATALSQPSLHRAIGDLSIALRRPLIERRGRGTMLTEAGRRTVRGFRLARGELEAGMSEVAALGGRESGRITIGAMPLARARLLPATVTAFHRLHPDVEIRILEGSYAELVEPLRDGEIDVLIGAVRGGATPDLDEEPLFEDRPVVLGRRGHPATGAADIAKLAAYPWTIAAPGTPLRAQWERMFADAGIAVPRVPIECGSVITIRQILIESDFLTLLSPDQVRVELEAGWLATICAAPPGLLRTIGITTRAGWRPTARHAAFVAMLRA
jgi:LysR family transcriptional regulator, regulator for genes of the gallate degradation pathway